METRNKILIGLVAIIIGIVVLNPIYFVQSGQKAVIKRFGVVGQEVIDEGMHVRMPFIDSVITVNVNPQNYESEVQTYTKDNQPIDVKFNVLFTNPVNDVANTVIRYNKLPYENFATSKIYDAFKAIAGKYTASDFVTKRELIRRDFLELAKKSVVNDTDGKPVINILDVPITNVDFDDQYENAIKEKQVDILCSTIRNKKYGNCDEQDVQRELGVLYYLWQQEAK